MLIKYTGKYVKIYFFIKIAFLLEIVRSDIKKHKMQLFPFRFHLT